MTAISGFQNLDPLNIGDASLPDPRTATPGTAAPATAAAITDRKLIDELNNNLQMDKGKAVAKDKAGNCYTWEPGPDGDKDGLFRPARRDLQKRARVPARGKKTSTPSRTKGAGKWVRSNSCPLKPRPARLLKKGKNLNPSKMPTSKPGNTAKSKL
ncbi:hypothetical protein PspLS_07529 [Pyricularia sp. CBS 133598]|nr:hypothetical protein PspLS_07529 [Pyricularia sp. CBS 133598]